MVGFVQLRPESPGHVVLGGETTISVQITLTADRKSRRVLSGSLVSEYGEGVVHRSHALVGAVTEGKHNVGSRVDRGKSPRRTTECRLTDAAVVCALYQSDERY